MRGVQRQRIYDSEIRAGKRFDYEHAKSLPPDAPNEDGYVTVDQSLLEWARYPSNRVREKAEEWQEYQKRFRTMLEKKSSFPFPLTSTCTAPHPRILTWPLVSNEMRYWLSG